MVSRRAFLAAGGGVALSSAAGAFLGLNVTTFKLDDMVIEEPMVVVPNLPREFHGYRIGLLTDLHLGVCIPDEFIRAAIDRVLGAQIDLLLLGGDYIWVPESAVAKACAVHRSPQFAGLPSGIVSTAVFTTLAEMFRGRTGRDGIFAVFGNHDRWDHPTACREAFREARIPLLLNESVTISRGNSSLLLIGVDDYMTGIPELPPLPPRANTVRVLLSHNPDFPAELLNSGRFDFDVALCGHTHGGQIRLPYLLPPLCNIRNTRYTEGLVRERDVAVYTSRGLGVVELPYRVACPPEVTVLTLLSE